MADEGPEFEPEPPSPSHEQGERRGERSGRKRDKKKKKKETGKKEPQPPSPSRRATSPRGLGVDPAETGAEAVRRVAQMAEVFPDLGAQRVTDYQRAVKVLRGCTEGLRDHVAKMQVLDPFAPNGRRELERLSTMFRAMYESTTSVCGDLEAIVGIRDRVLAETVNAIRNVARFEEMVRDGREFNRQLELAKEAVIRQRKADKLEREAQKMEERRKQFDEAREKRKLEEARQKKKEKKKRENERLEWEANREQREAEERERKIQAAHAAEKKAREEQERKLAEERERRRIEKERMEEEERQKAAEIQRKIQEQLDAQRDEFRRKLRSMKGDEDACNENCPDWVFGNDINLAETSDLLAPLSEGMKEVRKITTLAKEAMNQHVWREFANASGRLLGADAQVDPHHLLVGQESLFCGADPTLFKLLKWKKDAVPAGLKHCPRRVLLCGSNPSGELIGAFLSYQWKPTYAAHYIATEDIEDKGSMKVIDLADLLAPGHNPILRIKATDRYALVMISGLADGQANPPPQIPGDYEPRAESRESYEGDTRLPPLSPTMSPHRAHKKQRRLRDLVEGLLVACLHLGDGGVLIVGWPAAPYHPGLFFLVNMLRPAFKRVTVTGTSSCNSQCFGCYVVAVGFRDSSRGPDASEEGVAQLRQFLTSTQREVGLDDICAWDLTPSMLKKEYNRGRANYDAVIGHWPEYIENLAADTSFSASHPSGKKGARSSRKSLSPTKAAKGRKGKRGSGDDGGKGGESPRAGAVSPRAGEESPRVAEFGSSMTEFRSSLQEFRSSRTRFESPSIRLPAI